MRKLSFVSNKKEGKNFLLLCFNTLMKLKGREKEVTGRHLDNKFY